MQTKNIRYFMYSIFAKKELSYILQLPHHSATSPCLGNVARTTLSQLSKQRGSKAFLSCLIASTVLWPTSCGR
jgi:hypothetical protein